MSEEMKKLDNEDLESISGGKHHHSYEIRESLADCPPGTIEVKNDVLRNTHEKKKHCQGDNCDSTDLSDVDLYIVDTQRLVSGQKCNKCGAMWITK